MSSMLEKLTEAASNGNLISVLVESVADGVDKPETLEALVQLYRDSDVDVLSEFRAVSKIDVDYHAYFLVSLFNEWLVEISAPISDILFCVAHMEKLTEGAGSVQAFEKYCKIDPERSRGAIDVVLDSPNLSPLLSAVLVAGSNFDLSFFHNKTLLCLNSARHDIRVQALWACARLSYGHDSNAIDEAINSIEKIVVPTDDEILKSIALRVLVAIGTNNSGAELRCVEVIKNILQDDRPAIIQAVAHSFATLDVAKSSSIAGLFIEFFNGLSTIDSGTLRIITIGLNKYFESDRFLVALNLIEHLLQKNPELNIDGFEHFSYMLSQEKNRHFLEVVVTRWLLSNSHRLAALVPKLVAGDCRTGMPINAEAGVLKSLPSESRLLLAKRACAYLFIYPVSAASYIISMLATLPRQDAEKIVDVLYYPLGMSYPSSVKGYISSLMGPHVDVVKASLDRFESILAKYHEGLRNSDVVAELRPSTAQREAYYLKFHREMTESFKLARKKSTLFELFGKPSVILYGNSSINYVYSGSGGERLREETPMYNVSTSMEFPSLDHLDHHQLEYILRAWKVGRIPN